MVQGLTTISHGYYQPYFYWMFPIVVAREEGLFEKEGVTLEVHDIVPGGQPENKAEWYREALDERSRDFYFCCAWQGVYSTCETGKGKIGAAIKSTLIKTFGIYTKPDSPIRNILDITENGVQIAVNKNADAHYVTLENLAEFVPPSQIKLMHLGGIDGCFQALAKGEVQAATLAGPYAEAAEAIGYRRVMALSRTLPTLIVFNDAVETSAANSFLAAVNKAVDKVNGDRPFAHGGSHALHIARAHIANRKHAGQTGFQHLRKTAQGPSESWGGAVSPIQVAAGKDEALIIQSEATAQPFGSRRSACHDEHVPDVMN